MSGLKDDKSKENKVVKVEGAPSTLGDLASGLGLGRDTESTSDAPTKLQKPAQPDTSRPARDPATLLEEKKEPLSLSIENIPPLPKKPGFFSALLHRDPFAYAVFIFGIVFLGALLFFALTTSGGLLALPLFFVIPFAIAGMVGVLYPLYKLVTKDSLSTLMVDFIEDENAKNEDEGSSFTLTFKNLRHHYTLMDLHAAFTQKGASDAVIRELIYRTAKGGEALSSDKTNELELAKLFFTALDSTFLSINEKLYIGKVLLEMEPGKQSTILACIEGSDLNISDKGRAMSILKNNQAEVVEREKRVSESVVTGDSTGSLGLSGTSDVSTKLTKPVPPTGSRLERDPATLEEKKEPPSLSIGDVPPLPKKPGFFSALWNRDPSACVVGIAGLVVLMVLAILLLLALTGGLGALLLLPIIIPVLPTLPFIAIAAAVVAAVGVMYFVYRAIDLLVEASRPYNEWIYDFAEEHGIFKLKDNAGNNLNRDYSIDQLHSFFKKNRASETVIRELIYRKAIGIVDNFEQKVDGSSPKKELKNLVPTVLNSKHLLLQEKAYILKVLLEMEPKSLSTIRNSIEKSQLPNNQKLTLMFPASHEQEGLVQKEGRSLSRDENFGNREIPSGYVASGTAAATKQNLLEPLLGASATSSQSDDLAGVPKPEVKGKSWVSRFFTSSESKSTSTLPPFSAGLKKLYQEFNGGSDKFDEQKLWGKTFVDKMFDTEGKLLRKTELTILQFVLTKRTVDDLQKFLERLKEADKFNLKINTPGKNGESLLFWYLVPSDIFGSSEEQHKEIRKRLEKLIQAGTDVGLKNSKGITPLDMLIDSARIAFKDEDYYDKKIDSKAIGTLVSMLIKETKEGVPVGAYSNEVLRDKLKVVEALKDEGVSVPLKTELRKALSRELMARGILKKGDVAEDIRDELDEDPYSSPSSSS